ncbi:hypothetical protein OPT61_g1837 [Boeremia exigua]|uniref:Uncharacterized protein n=1 Tax=Boeremia exigua TaxID=749465 RepID=A0ACC2INR0_9PLEO|nr:hypothetical protein OPT61_g1837 [Boeremia exigua]
MANSSDNRSTADLLPTHNVQVDARLRQNRAEAVKAAQAIKTLRELYLYSAQAHHKDNYTAVNQPLEWYGIEPTPMLAFSQTASIFPATRQLLNSSHSQPRPSPKTIMVSSNDSKAPRSSPAISDELLAMLTPPGQQQMRLRPRRREVAEYAGAIFTHDFSYGGPTYAVTSHGHLQPRVQPRVQPQVQPEALPERWEQVPVGIRLMNEVCDAITIGSDFAFWSGLVIIVVVLIGLMIWYSDLHLPIMPTTHSENEVDSPVPQQDAPHSHSEQPRWDDLDSYMGSSDEDHRRRDEAEQLLNERMRRWTESRLESQSAESDSTVYIYEEDEEEYMEWRHGVVRGGDGGELVEIRVVFFAAGFVLIFLAGILIWIMII